MAEMSVSDMAGPKVVINNVLCMVITSGYNEWANQSGQGASRGYLCDWDQRFRVANTLLGVVEYTGTGSSGNVTLANPGKLDDIPALLVTGVRIEGKGQPYYNNVGLGFPYAIVWADYGMLPYVSGGGEAFIDPSTSFIYATQEIDASSQYVSFPGQALKYPDGTPANSDRSYEVVIVEMTITFHRLPYIPMPALAHGGKVNDALFLGIARGKVKFDGCKVMRDDSSGQVQQQTSFKFSYRPIADWNKVPDPKGSGTWVLLGYKGVADYPHPYYDLRAVWPGEYVDSL